MCLPFTHKWEVLQAEPIVVHATDLTDHPVIQRFTVYTLKCTKCGWIKGRKVGT